MVDPIRVVALIMGVAITIGLTVSELVMPVVLSVRRIVPDIAPVVKDVVMELAEFTVTDPIVAPVPLALKPDANGLLDQDVPVPVIVSEIVWFSPIGFVPKLNPPG